MTGTGQDEPSTVGPVGQSSKPVRATGVPYGRAAMDLLAAQVIGAKDGDPLAPVTVIVPSNYAAVAGRRFLASLPSGVANVTFLTLQRLAERRGAATLAAERRRPVSSAVLAAAVRAVLADEPGMFAPVAGHEATEQALVAATRELAVCTDPALDAVSACSGRAADVVRIARDARSRLARDWYDENDLLLAATIAAIGGRHDEGPVVIHLLQDLSPAAAEFVRALIAGGNVRVNVGLTGDPSADRPVLEAHARAGITVDDASVERRPARSLLTVSDPDEEVRAAVRQITQWMRDDVRLSRIAVLYANPNPYARLLHEHLTAAELPHNGASVLELGDMLLGRTLRRLLALPDVGFRRTDVLAVLTGAPLLDAAGEGKIPSRAWESISRQAGVVDGGDWVERLDTFAVEQRLRADEAERNELDRQAKHIRRDADRAVALAAYVARLQSDLRPPTMTWRDLVAWAHGLIDRYLGGSVQQRRWPEPERIAAEKVEEALDRLAGLDAVEGPPPTLEVFRRTLDAELDVALRRTGRFGDGVLVGHVSMAVGIQLDRVVVLGLAEGAFPARRLEDSLLPDDERATASGELPLRADRLHDDHRYLLAAVAAADEAVLCFPRGDLRRQGDRAASRWLLDDAAVLAGTERLCTAQLHAITAGWLEHVPSYAAGLVRTEFPATAQDHRLAAMARDPGLVIRGDLTLEAGMELARARYSSAFTRFDGNLAGLDLPDYTDHTTVVSASRLQTWAKCPHAFLLSYLLGVDVIEEPERKLEMSPLDKGSLIHKVLERFIGDAIADGRTPPWQAADRVRIVEIAEEVCAGYAAKGATGKAMLWRRDRARILADLDRFLTEDSGRSVHPLHAEMAFDRETYPLPDGRSVLVRGSVDRVDQGADGSIVVVDYKTGGTSSFDKLSETNPHVGGTLLQLGIYGTAVAARYGSGPVESLYWFTSQKSGFERKGYVVTPEIQASVGAAIATIVDGIRAGVFPNRPNPDPKPWVDCDFCSPDGLSTNELLRAWERKRSDPALVGYLALAEGSDDDA